MSVCLVPEAPFRRFVLHARRLEEAGCANVWVYANVSWRERPDVDVAGPLSALAAILGATRKLHAGLLVASPNLYDPVVLAKELLTLDSLSEGRVEVVLGSGSTGGGDPATDAGIRQGRLLSRGERAEVFEEFVQAYRHAIAFSAGIVNGSWAGRHYRVNLPRLTPRARENVVIGVAANGSRAMRQAASSAGRWVVSLPLDDRGHADLAELGALTGRFDKAYARESPAGPMTRTVFVPLNETWYQRSATSWREFLAAVSRMGFEEVVLHHPRPHDPALAGPSVGVFSAAFPGLSGDDDE